MKKSEINKEELINDTNKILEFMDKLDNMDIENIDVTKLEKDVQIFEKELNRKYKDLLPKDNLDSKE
jgi:Asp-tRNA(Asn)/Glu-tRNA(Gln) amidotransferase C subunit